MRTDPQAAWESKDRTHNLRWSTWTNPISSNTEEILIAIEDTFGWMSDTRSTTTCPYCLGTVEIPSLYNPWGLFWCFIFIFDNNTPPLTIREKSDVLLHSKYGFEDVGPLSDLRRTWRVRSLFRGLSYCNNNISHELDAIGVCWCWLL